MLDKLYRYWSSQESYDEESFRNVSDSADEWRKPLSKLVNDRDFLELEELIVMAHTEYERFGFISGFKTAIEILKECWHERNH